MTVLYQLATPLPEAERNARLYRGELIVFRSFDAMAQLTDKLRAHCFSHLGNDPTRAHQSMSPIKIEHASEALRTAVRNDSDVDLAWRQVLSELHTDLDDTYGDGTFIRVQPPRSGEEGERTGPLRAHRDTWGSNLPAQINWWTPLYDTTPERTLALFPGYFTQIIENDSADWNFQEMVRAYRAKNAPDYPLLPTATKVPCWEDALVVSLLPGDLLCFSGAHLHASVPNTTRLTRLSFETRTVNRSDMSAGSGAPNVDGSAPFMTPQIFRHLLNGQRLGELALVSPTR
ncbi:phytanoyl-CoA dioxygenase family protein [uncultured Marinobacter sp.]|uniref:phytanoyl-CoA dioxygenase family protein n=1 Tax=uncultured Marinobacter sp. TaxID=187379 RepID=UPI002618CAC9|nr:phytanoyl-CoA dioxygenase family protein [uncultured Marinobacter sp.]